MAEYKIPLRNRNKEIVDYTYVSEEDYENVDKHTWYRACPSKKAKTLKYYARSVIENKHISLHQFILEKSEEGLVIDHIDGNGLNNKRENLRFATRAQNNQNCILNNMETKTSKYIGVSLTASKTWAAFCSSKNLGTFKDELDAAKRYDSYVLKVYGKGALCNNLIKYEDVVNVDISEFLPKIIQRDLPNNINFHKRDKTYVVKIIHKGKKYISPSFKNIEDAKKALEDFKKEILKIKEQEKLEHNSQEIERNSDGIAIIKAYNNKKEVVTEALVDDDKWYELNHFRCNYDGRYCIIIVNGKVIPIHIYIHGRSEDDNLIDHINQNKLDNRCINLRYNTASGNNHNKSKIDGTVSKYIGLIKIKDKWSAQIAKNNKRYKLGTYLTELQAAIAYNIKAEELYGNFANLNDISIDDFEKNYDDVVKIMNNIKRLDNTSITSSKFRGVNKHNKSDDYISSITKNKIEYYLGTYNKEIEAAIAYNIKSIELNEKKAKLNEILKEDNEKYYDDVFKNMQRLKVI
jgi:hypothetical protein